MFLGLFKRKVTVVKVKRKSGTKKTAKSKVKKLPKVTKKAAARPKRKKPVVKKVKKLKVGKVSRPAKIMPQIVGKVTHYFPHVKAGVILVTKGKIALGDTLQIKGHSTDFKQKVNSIQINNVPIKTAVPKQEIGLLVKSRVRHNDVVYKL